MQLNEYLSKNALSQSTFAKDVGVTPGMVWQWLLWLTDKNDKRGRPISAESAKKIEIATLARAGQRTGYVLRHDLRPDIFDAPLVLDEKRAEQLHMPFE